MPAKHTEESAIEIMTKADFLPLTKYPGSLRPWKSKCLRCGEMVQPRLNAVKSGRRQCGFCSGARVKDSDAQLLLTSAGITPIAKFPGANKPWASKCNVCKRIVYPTYANIKNGHSGCAYCSGKKIDPEAAAKFMIDNNLQPLEDFQSTSAKWKCTCLLCGNEASPRYDDIRRGQGGCLRCGYVASANANKLGSEFAISTMHRAGVEPIDEYQGYEEPWRSRCMSCKRVVTPRLHSVMSGQGACKFCAGRAVDENFAEKVMKESGFTVCEPFPGSVVGWKSICNKCNRKVSPTYGNVRQGAGCKYCNAVSFQSDKPALIYLVNSEELGAHKIGIANIKLFQISGNSTENQRIKDHIRLGWKLFKAKSFESGLDALEIEQQVLSWLKNSRGLTPHLSKEVMPQGGYTETVDASEIDLPTIWAKIEEFSTVIN